jgi:pilus assembly protein Flp/PilA
MKAIATGVWKFLKDEEGATAIEYALLAGLIAVAFIAGATLLGQNLNTFFNNVAGCIATPASCNPFGGGGGDPDPEA